MLSKVKQYTQPCRSVCTGPGPEKEGICSLLSMTIPSASHRLAGLYHWLKNAWKSLNGLNKYDAVP